MFLVWIGLAFIVLKLLGGSVFAELSWWWVVSPLILAFLWFEFFERRLGLDKKRAHDDYEAARQHRFKQALQRDKRRR